MKNKLLSLIASNHMIQYIPKSNQLGVIRMSTPFLINMEFLHASTIQLEHIINQKKFVVYRPPLEYVNSWIINYDRRVWRPRTLLKNSEYKKEFQAIEIMLDYETICNEHSPYLPCFDFTSKNIINMSYFDFDKYINENKVISK